MLSCLQHMHQEGWVLLHMCQRGCQSSSQHLESSLKTWEEVTAERCAAEQMISRGTSLYGQQSGRHWLQQTPDLEKGSLFSRSGTTAKYPAEM